MYETEARNFTVRARDALRTPTVAFVPSRHSGRYAEYLFLLAEEHGSILAVPGIVGYADGSEPDTENAEALIGHRIGVWVRRDNGWYAEIDNSTGGESGGNIRDTVPKPMALTHKIAAPGSPQTRSSRS